MHNILVIFMLVALITPFSGVKGDDRTVLAGPCDPSVSECL